MNGHVGEVKRDIVHIPELAGPNGQRNKQKNIHASVYLDHNEQRIPMLRLARILDSIGQPGFGIDGKVELLRIHETVKEVNTLNCFSI